MIPVAARFGEKMAIFNQSPNGSGGSVPVPVDADGLARLEGGGIYTVGIAGGGEGRRGSKVSFW